MTWDITSIGPRNKYNWNAFSNVTKKVSIIKYVIYILPQETSTTGTHSVIIFNII